MKKIMLMLLMCCLGAATQAVVIDNFEDTDLTEYTMNYVLVQNGSNTTTFGSPSGALQVSKPSGDTDAEQTLFLRDDYSLAVGQTLRVNASVSSVSGFNCDIGLVVSATADPADAVWTSGTVDARQDFINMYIKAGSSGWGNTAFDGTTYLTGQSGYVTGQDLSVITGLFISRTAADVFDIGYSTASGDTVFRTVTVTNTAIGNAIGFYSDLRGQVTYGDLDNLRIECYPYDPSVVQTQDGTNNIDVLFQWNAASDPNAGTSGLAVDPDITAQYIFVGNENDPNMYYKGATGDPGNTPASSFDLQDSVQNDLTYYWVVVEAIAGYEQTLTIDSSTLDGVDPNNTVGPTWTFDSLTSIPSITQQPADVRAFTTDPNAVFTCEFTSIDAASVSWYKSGTPTPLSTAGDIIVSTTNDGSGNYVSTLEILTPAATDEGDYYCEIDNGTPLIMSDTASLIINQLLAQYDLDGSLAPAVGSAADAPTGQGKTVDGLAEPNSLLASNITLTFVEGVDGVAGHAVQIDPNQYVDFGTAGYPKASSLTNGLGRGLDEGTIVYWVKPNTNKFQAILGNFNTGFGVSQGFLSALQADGDQELFIRDDNGTTVADHVAGQPDRPEYDLTDGEWHMIAACWSGNSSALYVDGQWVGGFTGGTPTSYVPWEYGVLLGTTRQSARHLLNSSDMYGGLIDNLRLYNYRLDGTGVDVFAQEYLDNTNIHPCINMTFENYGFNFDNTGNSYCKVDLADFAAFASAWLANGLY